MLSKVTGFPNQLPMQTDAVMNDFKPGHRSRIDKKPNKLHGPAATGASRPLRRNITLDRSRKPRPPSTRTQALESLEGSLVQPGEERSDIEISPESSMSESWELLLNGAGESYESFSQNFGAEWERGMGLGVDSEPLAGHDGINMDSSIEALNITLKTDQPTTCGEGKTDCYDPLPAPQKKLLACPFAKFNPAAFSTCRYRCFRENREIKQHIRRRHLGATRDASQPAVDGEDSKPLSNDQKEALDRYLDRRLTKEKQWYKIWEILFPKNTPPRSPYHTEYSGCDASPSALGELWNAKSAEIMQQVFSAHGTHFDLKTHALINCLMSSAIHRLEQQQQELSSNSAASRPCQPTPPLTNIGTCYSPPELSGSCNWGQLDHMSTATGLWSPPGPGNMSYTEFGTGISEPAPLCSDLTSTLDDSLLLSLGGWANTQDIMYNNTAASTMPKPVNPCSTPWNLPAPTLPQPMTNVKVDDSNELDFMEYVML